MADGAKLEPVEYDPFALAPVDHDPFAGVPLMRDEPPTFASSPFASSGTLRGGEGPGAASLPLDASALLQQVGLPRTFSQEFGRKLPDVLNAASMLPGGGSEAIFAGPLAKGADLAARGVAKRLLAQGVSRETVYDMMPKGAKWFPDAAGDLKYEIPDAGAKLDPNYSALLESRSRPLGQILSHPEAYKAYPDLADIQVSAVPKEMRHDTMGYFNGKEMFINPELSPRETTSVILHEMSHPIQKFEGFQGGMSPERAVPLETPGLVQARGDLDKLYDAWAKREKELSATGTPVTGDAILDGLSSKIQTHAFTYESELAAAKHLSYRNTAGEVEARNVQERWEKSLYAKYPWETQEVPDAAQVLLPRRPKKVIPVMQPPEAPAFSLRPVEGDPFGGAK